MTGADPYFISDNRLMFRDEELCAGPLYQLEQFRDVLNAARPEDDRIGATLMALIRMTRDCSFAPGFRLLAEGQPVRVKTPQMRKIPTDDDLARARAEQPA